MVTMFLTFFFDILPPKEVHLPDIGEGVAVTPTEEP